MFLGQFTAPFLSIFKKLWGRNMPSYFEPMISTAKAAFGMQCFWHSEAYLASTTGVIRTRVGYAGGTLVNPTYKNLGDHIETVEVDYDPTVVTYDDLLHQFWNGHDPSVKHKRQYISAIFYYHEKQKQIALQSLQDHQKQFSGRLETEVLPMGTFYNAEDYHQKYLLRCEQALFNSLGLSDQQVIYSYVAAKLNGYAAGYGVLEQFKEECTKWGLSDSEIDVVQKMIIVKGREVKGCGGGKQGE